MIIKKPVQKRGITALLGPTNTGKTTRALERMLSYDTGVIGFPLRVLARENYDRLCEKCGSHRVALVTGEERIIPPLARYYVATVEAMPLSFSFSFMAVDEIQMMTDPHRGHVFTNRLLYQRGIDHTVFIGSSAMESLIMRLVPDIEIEDCERLSSLDYSGRHLLRSLPKRSAVVAFSARDVYENGDHLRRTQGGAAVVMGAMSPQARRLQVDLFERGEVDYLVATDAIGMGLNLSIDHVAFSHLHKFDGHTRRPLHEMEIGQIAGRAGRGDKDGTFGVTGDAPEIASSHVETVIHNRYVPYKWAFWRNPHLSWNSPRALLKSLKAKPPHKCLKTAVFGDDEKALSVLSMRARVRSDAQTKERVKMLWDVCRIPDYEKQFFRKRMGFLEKVFRELCDNGGVLPSFWVEQEIRGLKTCEDHTTALMHHLGRIRTWSYITEQSMWFSGVSGHKDWHERLLLWEEEFSGRLHRRLMDRFVGGEEKRGDRSHDHIKDVLAHMALDEEGGDVVSQSHVVAQMKGLVCGMDRATLSVPRDKVHRWLKEREEMIVSPLLSLLEGEEGHEDVTWDMEGKCRYRGGVVARCEKKGKGVIKVEVVSEWLSEKMKERLTEALQGWQDREFARYFRAFDRFKDKAEDKVEEGEGEGEVSWLFSRVREGLGVGVDITSREVEMIKRMRKRPFYRRRFCLVDSRFVYMPELMMPFHVKMRAIMKGAPKKLEDERYTLAYDEEAEACKELWQALGFVVVGNYGLRADIWASYRKVCHKKTMTEEEMQSFFYAKEKEVVLSFLHEEGWERLKGGYWCYKGRPRVKRKGEKKKPLNPVLDKSWLRTQKKSRLKAKKEPYGTFLA